MIELTEEEVATLKLLLSLDMDSIGFEDEQQDILEGIYEKL